MRLCVAGSLRFSLKCFLRKLNSFESLVLIHLVIVLFSYFSEKVLSTIEACRQPYGDCIEPAETRLFMFQDFVKCIFTIPYGLSPQYVKCPVTRE